MDGLLSNDLKTKIFTDLKVFDNVEFVRVPEFYRFQNGRIDITVPDDYPQAQAEFIKHFPAEQKGIRKFFAVITGIKRQLEALPREPWKILLQIPFFPFLYPTVLRYSKKSLGEIR